MADRDLVTAQHMLTEDLDWTYNIVYNAVLQAARALMLYEGFRARRVGQHRTAVEFCASTLGPEHRQQVALFDQMRRKRNRLVYEMVGLVSRQEAEQVLAFARDFVEEIRLRVTGQLRMDIEPD